jgi:hypothetical protein
MEGWPLRDEVEFGGAFYIWRLDHPRYATLRIPDVCEGKG